MINLILMILLLYTHFTNSIPYAIYGNNNVLYNTMRPIVFTKYFFKVI